jgi:hypothetical protein
VSLYVKVGAISGHEVAELTGRSLAVPSASRDARPVQEEDLLQTPDGRWLMLRRDGMYDVGRAVRDVEGGVLIDWGSPNRALAGQSQAAAPMDRAPGQHRFVTPNHTIVVGWDNPLGTFFAQVWPGYGEDGWGDEPEFWVGCQAAEVPTVEALAELLRPFAELPLDVADLLRRDCGRRRVSESPVIELPAVGGSPTTGRHR